LTELEGRRERLSHNRNHPSLPTLAAAEGDTGFGAILEIVPSECPAAIIPDFTVVNRVILLMGIV
jgi:hypothetical protein